VVVRPSTPIVIEVEACALLESVTVTETLNVPACETEPLSDPVALRLTPVGSPLAENVYGGLPPLAEKLAETAPPGVVETELGDTEIFRGGTLATVKDWVTGVAAAYVALPDWVAVIEQLPAPTIMTVFVLTVQTDGVVEMKLTGRPELAVAETANDGAPSVTLPSGPKVMVWFC
jgi:hypothetical protein